MIVAIVLASILTLFDFESTSEAANVRVGTRQGTFGISSDYPSFGEKAFAFCPDSWCEGADEWPSVTFVVPEGKRDWTDFEKLSVDIITAGPGDGQVKCYIAAPEGRIQSGYLVPEPQPLKAKRWCRWEFPLASAAKRIDLRNVGRIHFFMTRPKGMNVHFDRISLMLNTESLPLPDSAAWKRLDEANRYRAAAEAEERKAAHRKMVSRLVETSAGNGKAGSPAFALAVALPTEKVRPDSIGDWTMPPKGLQVRLARNESEAMQLLVFPVAGDLKGVSVETDLPMVSVAPVGYVRTVYEPPYTVYPDRTVPEPGWWPDPILSFLEEVDVKADTVQSFWVEVKCPEDNPAGTYRGNVRVSADGLPSVTVPMTIRVNDFTIPRTPVMPVTVTFNPGPRDKTVGPEKVARIWADPDSPVNAWKRHKSEWTDFLADHGIALFNLYHDGSAFHSALDFAELERLDRQGRLPLVNLGYWRLPVSLAAADVERWRAQTLPRLKENWRELVKRGWQRKACLYGADEAGKAKFPLVCFAAAELKREFPGVPLFTTAYDDSLGMADEGLKAIDWFTPVTSRWNDEAAEKSRAAGHRVWWYIACGPVLPWANVFVETTGLETRLLMGGMAQKYRPDGFLYYQSAIWNAAECITKGPYTDWEPRSFRRFHGDGSLTCVGPDGIPLATLRLKAFRDGLEDLAYARELERRSGRKVKVPESLVRSLAEFSLDGKELFSWRDRLADAIESQK